MIFPRIGLSHKKHLPCFKIGTKTFTPWGFARVFWSTRHLKFKKITEKNDLFNLYQLDDELISGCLLLGIPFELFQVKYKDFPTIILSTKYLAVLLSEWGKWEKQYLPKDGVKGKTILDVGAGNGETAYFYFVHGAKKVISIEPDPYAFRILEINQKSHDWDWKLRQEFFNLFHLLADDFDFMKMDGEGCEAKLIYYPPEYLPRHFSLEVHSKRAKNMLLEAFDNLKLFETIGENQYILKTD